ASCTANLPPIAVSFIEGFRTPAPVQAASSRWAGIRNPQHLRPVRASRMSSHVRFNSDSDRQPAAAMRYLE
ncbi:MAG: hypothetical protein ABSA90_15730, partial [Xanthobacteraceae bacterium]